MGAVIKKNLNFTVAEKKLGKILEGSLLIEAIVPCRCVLQRRELISGFYLTLLLKTGVYGKIKPTE